MAARKKTMDLPDTFSTLEEAGDFWDTHSVADYENITRSVQVTFDLSKRTRYIAIPDKIYQKISAKARKKHVQVKDLVYALSG
jgi:hypothetical protein